MIIPLLAGNPVSTHQIKQLKILFINNDLNYKNNLIIPMWARNLPYQMTISRSIHMSLIIRSPFRSLQNKSSTIYSLLNR